MTAVIPKSVQFDTYESSDQDDEAQRLMAEHGFGNLNDDAEDEVTLMDEEDDDKEEIYTDYDDRLEKFRRDVEPGDNEIDHIVLGTSDLDKALEVFEDMTGMKPVMVVSLNGVGTKSARVAFSGCSFLEIIGPDPKQAGMAMSEKLAAIPSGKMVPLHYAVRSKKAVGTNWSANGLECDKVTMVAKDKGLLWKWDMHLIEGHHQGGIFPYFVDWGNAHHASGRLPIVGSLDRVVVRCSGNSLVHDLLLGVDGVFADDGDNLLEFTFSNAKGTHKFSSATPIGITFPK
jgi:hypothetical protein